MKILFCPRIAGHRLEYINHLYGGAVNDPNNDYKIAVPRDFDRLKDLYVWPNANNIRFDYLDDTYTSEIRGNLLKQAKERCLRLKRYLATTDADEVILLDLIEYIPFLPYYIKGSVKVKGIIYRIYLYDYKQESLFKRMLDKFKYLIISKSKVIDKVFILNSEDATIRLNSIFSTTKYCYLEDPVVPITKLSDKEIRKIFDIPESHKIILHPGGMLDYKGTIEILEAIKILDNIYKQRYTFIFAGRITKSIRTRFFELYEQIKESANVIIIEDFLPFDYLGRLLADSDYILIPYKIKSQSSGILGHAAYFKKPLIAVKGGLIGDIVEKYKLGLLIDSCSPESIKHILENLPEYDNSSNTYCEEHTIKNFTNTILN